MSGRFLLDTNIVIALFKNDTTVASRLSTASEVFISSVVLGELYYGAERSAKRNENVARIDQFAASSSILTTDLEVAREYGVVKQNLHKKGTPIPENDIWIASVALKHNLVLVSRDSHFSQVDRLTVEAW